MVGWESQIMPIITNSDWGFAGNIIPIIFILGISWALVKKPKSMGFIQLPVTIAIKLIFPFLHMGIVTLSIGLFALNLIGSKGDMIADVKESFKRSQNSLDRAIVNERIVEEKVKERLEVLRK